MEEKTQLSETLFNKPRYRILNLILEKPEKNYSIKEIKQRTEVSRPIIAEFLEKLEEIGLVERTKKGNMYLTDINKESPYLEPMEKLLKLDTEPLKKEAKNLAEELVKTGKAESVYLFGSVARGSPGTSSDVDLLVIHKGEKNKIQRQIEKKNKETGTNFSATYYTKKELEKDRERGIALIERIKEEGIQLAGEEKL